MIEKDTFPFLAHREDGSKSDEGNRYSLSGIYSTEIRVKPERFHDRNGTISSIQEPSFRGRYVLILMIPGQGDSSKRHRTALRNTSLLMEKLEEQKIHTNIFGKSHDGSFRTVEIYMITI